MVFHRIHYGIFSYEIVKLSHRSNFIVDGVRYPSVTEILSSGPKPWLDKWHKKWGVLADRKLQCANNIGDDFDATATDLVNGVIRIPDYRRVVMMIENFYKGFYLPYTFVCEAVQLHVVSKNHWFHGTFDAVGYVKGKPELCLFDWKTSAQIYPDMALQLAAYAIAYEEQTGIKMKKGYIVHVSKDKPTHRVTVKEYKLNKMLRNHFLLRLKDFRERNPNE